jgi:hypothetical protein
MLLGISDAMFHRTSGTAISTPAAGLEGAP